MRYQSSIVAATVLLGLFFAIFSISHNSKLREAGFSYAALQEHAFGKHPPPANLTHEQILGIDLSDIRNETLGFEKIYMVSLPERTDKRDTLSMQARLSNMTFTMVDGVYGKEVSPKALPYTFDQSAGVIGCWRAHLNIMQEMVMNNIQSALVFEDDADWDVGIRGQMREMAKGARYLGNSLNSTIVPHSPYGDDWDILWVGHCSVRSHSKDPRRWVVPHDHTVIPPNNRGEFEKPRMDTWDKAGSDNQTRVILTSAWNSCTAAYAISLRGAEKVLLRQSLTPFNEPIDNGMGHMCGEEPKDKELRFNCIAPFPTIVGTSVSAGPVNRGSDINYDSMDKAAVREESESWRLMFPVRQNIRRLLAKKTSFSSWFPDVTGKTMELETIMSAVGHPEVIDLEAEKQANQREHEQWEAEEKKKHEEWEAEEKKKHEQWLAEENRKHEEWEAKKKTEEEEEEEKKQAEAKIEADYEARLKAELEDMRKAQEEKEAKLKAELEEAKSQQGSKAEVS